MPIHPNDNARGFLECVIKKQPPLLIARVVVVSMSFSFILTFHSTNL